MINTLLRTPRPGSVNVPTSSPIAVTVDASGETFQTIRVLVNDVLVYEYASGSGSFRPPDSYGSDEPSSTGRVINVSTRRRFNAGGLVGVRVIATTNLTPETVYDATFHAAPAPGSVRDRGLIETAVDRPLPRGRASLELLRRTLLGAFGFGNGSFLTLLFHCVKRSQLRSVVPPHPRSVEETLTRLLPSEAPDIVAVDEAVGALSFLRPNFDDELRDARVAPELLELIARSWDAPYPQERVGAAALSVLLGAT